MQEQTDGPAFPIEMDLKEFKEAGFLQEVNRLFFHPLGLALAMERTEDGPTGKFKVWDGRDDPEGFVFETWELGDAERAARISLELQARLKVREERLGYTYQPIETPSAVGRD